MADHEKGISGYRTLTQPEIDAINTVKAMGREVAALIRGLEIGVGAKGDVNVDRRWLSIAQTDLQKGFMALTRAIARPEGF